MVRTSRKNIFGFSLQILDNSEAFCSVVSFPVFRGRIEFINHRYMSLGVINNLWIFPTKAVFHIGVPRTSLEMLGGQIILGNILPPRLTQNFPYFDGLGK